MPIYLAQAGHSAACDGFYDHVCKLLPTKPEVNWPFGADGYLDCGDVEPVISAVWDEMEAARES